MAIPDRSGQKGTRANSQLRAHDRVSGTHTLLALFLEGLGATALLLTPGYLLLGHVDILLSSEVSCLGGESHPRNRLR
jgi:hypothetical protein